MSAFMYRNGSSVGDIVSIPEDVVADVDLMLLFASDILERNPASNPLSFEAYSRLQTFIKDYKLAERDE